ncbi:MAG TPA: radical SAM protein [Clostridiales bacterium]|nr:radical SAM protein [Clostridiales bacterium]HQH63440.1 radical SAM protein [Clostridiales bacterium]HQK72887.1 radical SAM protein [Clostridiales bacterium]
MNVLLICPKPEISTRSVYVPLGILSVATYLREHGHTVQFTDRSVRVEKLETLISKFKPDIAGLSLMTTKAIRDARLVSETLRAHQIPVVWGGTLVSDPAFFLKSGYMDFVIKGEGEVTMLALIDALKTGAPFSEIKGLSYIDNGEPVVNEPRELADLADLPVIDWSFTDPSRYFSSFFACNRMLYLYASKGCPCQCTYCTNKDYHRAICRKRPLEYVTREITHLVQAHGMDGVYFTDEYCCKTPDEMFEFCDSLKSIQLPFVWGATTKINGFTVEDFRYMYDAGCRWLFFGIESGSKEMLAKIKKGIAYDLIVETVENCLKAGIVAITAFIAGFPGETEQQLRETVDLAFQMPGAMHVINIFTPLPGSELYQELKNEGKLKPPKSLEEVASLTPFEQVFQNFSNVPSRDLRVIRAFFLFADLFRKKPSKETKPFVLVSKVLREQFRDMSRDGFWMFFPNFAKTFILFLSLLADILCFPHIRKKYRLYTRVTKRIIKKL